MGPESTGDQSEVFALLGDPATHGLTSDKAIKRIDTHGAVVFLAGGDVYKVKRAVRFPFMDFSTLEKRRLACESEIRVNRGNAPALYLGTIPIRRGPQGVRLAGESGEIVEWAVHLRRFDETATLDLLADRGELNSHVIAELADIVLAAHDRAPLRDLGATRVFPQAPRRDARRSRASRRYPPCEGSRGPAAAFHRGFRNGRSLADRARGAGQGAPLPR